MVRIITSQRYLDTAIVAEKFANEDYTVLLSPVFILDGEEFQAIIDGHHSLEAAKRAGVEPNYVVATARESDTVALLKKGDLNTFLELQYGDGDWFDIDTGGFVWC